MRYIQFDALRGMAALSVLLSHFIGMMPVLPVWLKWLSGTPGHIIWDGAAAVNLFFVLSGFCVALPYMRQENPRPIAYISFLLRRFFRLYPAYAVALFLCILAKSFYISPPLGSVSPWGMEFWQWDSLTGYQWLTLFGMIYHIDTKLLDPPTWSLVVEMKMAFILPMMFWGYQRLKFKWQATLTFGLLLLMLFHSSNLDYACHFAFGIMVAKERMIITNIVAESSLKKVLLMLMIGVFLYTCRWPWRGILVAEFGEVYWVNALFEILNGMGSVFLIIVFFHPAISRTLSNVLGSFLGKISYSVYLIHFPVLLLCVAYLQNWYMSFVILLSVSLLLSWLMFIFVERPMIRIGQCISEKYSSPIWTSINSIWK